MIEGAPLTRTAACGLCWRVLIRRTPPLAPHHLLSDSSLIHCDNLSSAPFFFLLFFFNESLSVISVLHFPVRLNVEKYYTM